MWEAFSICALVGVGERTRVGPRSSHETRGVEPSAIAVPSSGVARKAPGTVTSAKISPIHAITLAALFQASPSSAVTPAATKKGTTDVPSTTNQGMANPLPELPGTGRNAFADLLAALTALLGATLGVVLVWRTRRRGTLDA